MTALSYRLDKRVTIQSRSMAQDTAGQRVESWSDVAAVFAEVKDLTGREYIAAGGTQNAVQTKILIRYRSGIQPSMRVVRGALVYDIEAVLEQDRDLLLLMCKRVT